MDPFAAVGFASNVLQFVEFSAKLIYTAKELRSNATSSENKDHATIATHFQALSQDLDTSAKKILQTSATLPPEEKAIQPVLDGCCELAKQLLKRLETCGIKPSQNGSQLHRAKKAIKIVWSKKEIDDYANRLEFFRSEVTLHLTSQIRNTLIEQRAEQSTKDDIKTLLNKFHDLRSPIEDLKHSINGTLKANHLEVSNSINDFRAENLQLHAQGSHTLANMVKSLTDYTKAGFQDVRNLQTQTQESVARVEVQRSEFRALATQRIPFASNGSASFQDVLTEIFDNYLDTFIAGTNKEYRGLARSSGEILQQAILYHLSKMQSDAARTQESSGSKRAGKPHHQSDNQVHEFDETPFDLQRGAMQHGQASHRLNKHDISIAYFCRKQFETRIGVFTLQICRKDIFTPSQPVMSIFEMGAHFLPSPGWFPGISVSYKHTTDSRGNAHGGPQFKSYRVLKMDHEVWGAIKEGDFFTVRDMLSQKTISPSDRNEMGQTLLHYAIEHGSLPICEALVQKGADINARDRLGNTPLAHAILPYFIVLQPSGREIFHFLYSLSNIEIEELWLNETLLQSSIMSIETHICGIGASPSWLKKFLRQWQSVCQLVEFDFDIPDSSSFLENLIRKFANWDPKGPRSPQLFVREDMPTTPFTMQDNGSRSTIFHVAWELQLSGIALDVPVALAGTILAQHLKQARESSAITRGVTDPLLQEPFRGYRVSFELERALNFLEDVIELGIEKRPESIFDCYEETTIFDVFVLAGWEEEWKCLVEGQLIDWEWAVAENERRKRVVLGKTSAHEVSVGVDISGLRKVNRRGGYAYTEKENTEKIRRIKPKVVRDKGAERVEHILGLYQAAQLAWEIQRAKTNG
ncbi:hypothetical protein F5B20DRAFT_524057 [Whalleya microplaca]|nr:hypothetical protein F5B20DRAFT_524057 [Whalleya microplaca]